MSKGAYKYEGGKCMSSKRPAFMSQGKMSSSHGQLGKSKNNNMSHNTGGYRIGEGVRTFHHNGIKQHSGVPNDTKHARQPKGHKSQ